MNKPCNGKQIRGTPKYTASFMLWIPVIKYEFESTSNKAKNIKQ